MPSILCLPLVARLQEERDAAYADAANAGLIASTLFVADRRNWDKERARLQEERDEAVEAQRDAEWSDALMTAQRDQAFKHLTKLQQGECVRAACREIQPLTLAALASPGAAKEDK